MDTHSRFQSVGVTSDFGTKLAQNYINDKTSKKVNIKTVLSIS